MKRASTGVILLLLLLCAMAVLSACGAPPAESSDPNPDVVDQPVDVEDGSESIFRITGSFPLYIDPGVGAGEVDASVFFNIYDSLVFIELDGSLSPHIAESWDVSEDGLTYTFKLRQGVKFHDGSEVMASDVAFSMNRLLALGTGFAYLYTPYVESAEALDDYTVQFNMIEAFGPFVNSLIRFYVLNEELVMANLADGAYGDYGDYGQEWLLYNDAGSGPYYVTEMVMGTSMTAQRFTDYWDDLGEDIPEVFQILQAPDSVTIKTMMSNGELEITDAWQSTENLTAMEEMDGVDVGYFNTGIIFAIEMNTKKAPTDDIHFRKALSYLMDYDTVCSSVINGATKAYGAISSSYLGADDTVFTYEYNVEKALEELQQSKYYNDLDSYPINIMYSADVADEEKVALMLQAAASQVGITIKLMSSPWGSILAAADTVETSENLTICLPADSYNEAGSVLALRYHSNTSGTFTQFEWLQDTALDGMINNALSTIDKDARIAQYSDIQHYVSDLCCTINVCEFPERRAYQAGHFEWEAIALNEDGEMSCPIMGRLVYLPEFHLAK